MIGHSLGGLFCRFAIGPLSQWEEFDRLELCNFITLATPHLGTRRPNSSFINTVIDTWTRNVLSITGQQLLLEDSAFSSSKPLLAHLADPNSMFFKTLARFKRRVLYANLIGDFQVAYSTSSIRHNPHPAPSDLTFHPDWPVIVNSSFSSLSVPSTCSENFNVSSSSSSSSSSSFLDIQVLENHSTNCTSESQTSNTNVSSSFPSNSPPRLLSQSLPAFPIQSSLDLSEIDHDSQSITLSTSGISQSSSSSPPPSPSFESSPPRDDLGDLLARDSKRQIIKQMMDNLNTLSWDRYDVAIDSPMSHIYIEGKSNEIIASTTVFIVPTHISHHFIY